MSTFPSLHLALRCAALALIALLTSCASWGGGPTFPTTITGIDHLADHLSVQQFYVNGTWASRAGQGGRQVCCVILPKPWRPGLKVRVRWGVLNWRDRKADRYERDVEVERYGSQGGWFLVHFLPDGSVRAVVSLEGPTSPDYPGPRIPIPNKDPWDRYPPPEPRRKTKCTDYSVTPPQPCKG